MKFSIRTKFAVYTLPAVVLLPVLLYTLVTPYTQLLEAFNSFKIDAGRAREAEELAELTDIRQLELIHLIATAPATSYEFSTASNAADFTKASSTALEQLEKLRAEVDESVASYDEEREILGNIELYYGELNQLSDQAIILSTHGKRQEAFALLSGQTAGLVDEYLRPEIERMQLIKENDVKTILPALTNTLSRRGVIPIPGLQSKIFGVINHFENSVDAEKLGQLLFDLQITVFDQALGGTPSPAEAASQKADIDRIEERITSTFLDLKSRLSSPEDDDELAKIATLETMYARVVTLNAQAETLLNNGKQKEALALLTGDIDIYIEQTLQPTLEDLIIGDGEDVDRLIAQLGTELGRTVYVLYFIGALLFLLSIGALWRLSHEIIIPILALRKIAERLAGGDFAARADARKNDEIGDLARAFNTMASQLQEAYGELQDKVMAQTALLSTQVTALESTKKGMLNLLEDLKHEKEITEMAHAKDEAILGSIGDAVFAIDTEKRIVLFNPVAEALSGWKLSEALNKPYQDILHFVVDEQKKESVTFIDSALKGTKTGMSGDTVLIAKDGTQTPVADSAAPILNGAGVVTGVVVVFRDVTHEREVDKAKNEFVSLASHQLRTPLTAIKWYVELLSDGAANALTKDQESYLSEIQSASTRMELLINSFLNVSRLELGTFSIEPVETDVITLIGEAVHEQEQTFKDRKQKLEFTHPDTLPMISVDPKLLYIIVQNLLSNAHKYSPEGARVALTLSQEGEVPSGSLLITCEDTGYGIPKGQQERIFTKLFRADNIRTLDVEGTGLGLYIIKAILEASGGTIEFSSEENKGSVFRVRIPLTGMCQKEGTRALTKDIVDDATLEQKHG